MTHSSFTPTESTLPRLFNEMAAVCAGLAVPFIAFGPGGMGVAIAMCILAMALSSDRSLFFSYTWHQAFTIVGMAVLFVFACWLVSALGSFEIGRSLEKWGRTFFFVFLAVMLWRLLSESPRALELCLRAVIFGSLACGIFVLLCQFFMPETPDFLKYSSIGNLFTIQKGYGSVAACLIPATLVAGFVLGGRWRWLGVICAPVLFGVVYSIWQPPIPSRAGLLGLSGGILILCFWVLIRTLPHHLAWMATIVITVLLSWTIISRLPAPPITDETSFEIPFSLIDQHRQIIWGFTLEKAKAAPWFGHGPDVVNRLPGADVWIPNFRQEYIPAHPHNWALEILAETGGIGFSALVVALFLFLRELVRVTPNIVIAGILALNGVFWAAGLVNVSFWSAWWQGTYLLLSALLIAAMEKEKA